MTQTGEEAAGPPHARTNDGRHTSRAPLAGVRVLDLSRLLPGPMCTLHLAQLGADVVKIEDTGPGDYARGLGGPPAPSTLFSLVNRGKRSVAIDLKHPRGRDVFFALVKTAHVVVESFRPGVVRSLGVGYDAVAAVEPRIVYASISGYGQDGPRARAAGHDINYLAIAGVLEQIGARDGDPAVPNLQIADLLGGAAMPAVAILAALFDAARTGQGRHVDVAMADATLAHNVLALQALQALQRDGTTAGRGDDMLTGGMPCYGIYATSDGRHLAVGALEERFWRTLCEALGRPDLAASGHARGDEGRRTRDAIAAEFASASLAEWTRRLAGHDCCVTPVMTLDEALQDPQFVARGMVLRDRDGRVVYGAPFRLSDTAMNLTAPAPQQGEHTQAMLREIGLDADDIAALHASGAVTSPSAA